MAVGTSHVKNGLMAKTRRRVYDAKMDEGRKRVVGIMAAILAARKLAQHDGVRKVPATISAVHDAVRWAEEIMKEIDRLLATKQEAS